MSPDLIVDCKIREWVFMPIVLITFLVGILRHYVSIILTSDKGADAQQVWDNQVLLRSKILRENCKYIPKDSFYMRKHYFNVKENGYLTKKRSPLVQNAMYDPSLMLEMLKGNVTNVISMIVIGILTKYCNDI